MSWIKTLIFQLLSHLLFVEVIGAVDYANDLVAEIEGGNGAARLIADHIGVDLLGEVIPDSNIFHFGSKRIVKRSLDDIRDEILKFPNVRNVYNQKVNKRVKRDLNERELSVREQCFVSTIETQKSPSKRCVFPFEYKGVLYQRCTSDHSTNGKQWCATSVTREGAVIVGEWGDCDFATSSAGFFHLNHHHILFLRRTLRQLC